MMVRTQISLEAEQHRRAKQRAAELGVSLGEYVRRAIERELGEQARTGDITAIFGLGKSGLSDVSENVDEYYGEAIEHEYLRETGQLPRE